MQFVRADRSTFPIARPCSWNSPESPLRSYRHGLAKLIFGMLGRHECEWRLSDNIDGVDLVATTETLKPLRQQSDDIA